MLPRAPQTALGASLQATNVGNIDLANVTFRVYVLVDPGQPKANQPMFETAIASLAKGASAPLPRNHTFAITGLEAKPYIAVLEADYGTLTQEFDRAVFIVVDGDPPTCDILKPPLTPLTWYNNTYDVRATVTDFGTGVEFSEYSLDGTNWSPLPHSGTGNIYEVTGLLASGLPEGQQTVSVRARDNVGNDWDTLPSDPNPWLQLFGIDTIDPVVTLTVAGLPLDCNGIYHTAVNVAVSITDLNLSTTTVLLDTVEVTDWATNGIDLPAAGDYDYTIDITADDLAGNVVNVVCPVQIQPFGLAATVNTDFPRVLLFDDDAVPGNFIPDTLANNGIYYQEAATLTEFTDKYRSGAFDIAFIHRAVDGGSAVHDELESQVFKEEGLLVVKLDVLPTPELADVLGVMPLTVLPSVPQTLEMNASPLTLDESTSILGATLNLNPTTAQIIGRHIHPGGQFPAAPCQGSISVDYKVNESRTATSLNVEVSDLMGPVDTSRVAIEIIDVATLQFRIKSLDGYRLESPHHVKVTGNFALPPTQVVYEDDLTSDCSTTPGPHGPQFFVTAVDTISLYGISAPHPPAWVVALHRHGLGAALTCGFDLQATQGARIEQLLLDAVEYLRTSRPCPRLGGEVVPLEATAENLSPFDAKIELQVDLDSGVTLFDSVDTEFSLNPLTYRFDLDAWAETTVTYLARLPDTAGAAGSTTTLRSQDDLVNYTDVTTAAVSCSVIHGRSTQVDIVYDLIDALMLAATPGEAMTLFQARTLIDDVRTPPLAATATDVEYELVFNLLAALDLIKPLTSVNPSETRVELGHLIRMWQAHWYELSHP